MKSNKLKKNYFNRITVLFLSVIFLAACTKNLSTETTNPLLQETAAIAPIHVYGLQSMTEAQWSGVQSFDVSLLFGKYATNGLSYSGTLPANYLMVTPNVRDQGQIGACTGFCGAETEAILKYYQANAPQSISGILTSSTGLATAVANQFTSPTSIFGTNGALSPLFLYYVERVAIRKEAISADNGANMVNIGQALQGTVANTSSSLVSYNGTNFKGTSTEDLYPYPSVINANGYNVATSSSTNYLTAPSSAAILNAPNFSLALQTGSTTNSNTGATTSHGYYVITSTGSTLLTDVKTALANNKPVMMGFNVYDNTSTYAYFEHLNTTSYTYNPLTTSGKLATGVRLLGGHAVPIVGYINDSSKPGGGVFIVENSWGKPWGYYGFFYLPYSVIQSTTIVPSGSLYVAIL